MRTILSPLAIASLFLFLTHSSICAEEFTLSPAVGRGPYPVEQDVSVRLTTPRGWHREPGSWESDKYITFSPIINTNERPIVELTVSPFLEGNVSIQGTEFHQDPRKDPRNSECAVHLRQAANITKVKKVESFDGGENGKLSVWRLHTIACDVYVVLIVKGHVEVDICLRCEDASRLKPYLADLKQVARSVRILKASE